MSFALMSLLMLVMFTIQDLIVGSYDAGQRVIFAAIVLATAVAGCTVLYLQFRSESAEKRERGFIRYFMKN